MIEIELYWDDLTPAIQNRIRRELNMDNDDNGNWDVFPIATLSFEELERD